MTFSQKGQNLFLDADPKFEIKVIKQQDFGKQKDRQMERLKYLRCWSALVKKIGQLNQALIRWKTEMPNKSRCLSDPSLN